MGKKEIEEIRTEITELRAVVAELTEAVSMLRRVVVELRNGGKVAGSGARGWGGPPSSLLTPVDPLPRPPLNSDVEHVVRKFAEFWESRKP